jgi:excinuclease UvrABC helicase subunit UvrB
MSQNHSPEPWMIVNDNYPTLINANEKCLFTIALGGVYGDDYIANINRIIQCVNACEGMSDPTIEIKELCREIEELHSEIKQLKCQQK